MDELTRLLSREVLLAFWKVHILHHAAEEPIYGQGILKELRRHGYEISPGTLYPLLQRLEKRGWLGRCTPSGAGPHARRNYEITVSGRQALALLREKVRELYNEVILEAEEGHHDE